MQKTALMDDYFGLIFRAMKSDLSVSRVVAFIRRLLQMCLVNESNFTAASLLVLSEILGCRADVRFELFQSKAQDKSQAPVISAEAVKESDDEDEEHFLDVDRV
jgi:ribosome biogenesis protein MAK21